MTDFENQLTELMAGAAQRVTVNPRIGSIEAGAQIRHGRAVPQRVRRIRLGVSIASVVTLVLAGGIALTLRQNRSTIEASGTGPTFAPPYYLLPKPDSGYKISIPYSAPITSLHPMFTVVGVADGAVYRNLMVISVAQTRPESNAKWASVQASNGDAQVSRDVSIRVHVVQQRAGVWISILTRSELEAEALSLLPQIQVTDELDLQIGAAAGVQILKPFDVATDVGQVAARDTTGFEVSGPGIADWLKVETASDFYTGLAFISAETARKATVAGRQGWELTRPDEAATNRSVVWQAAPGLIGMVSGFATLKVLNAVAESLVVVDEAAWKAVSPESFVEPLAFGAETDALANILRGLGNTAAASAEQLITRVTQMLLVDNCEGETATVSQRSGLDPMIVTIEYRSVCDDAGGGADFNLVLGTTPGGTWTIQSATSRDLCVRGVTDDGMCI
jgi:hypothetical protein